MYSQLVFGLLGVQCVLANICAQQPSFSTFISFDGVPYTASGLVADYNTPNVVQTAGILHLSLTQQTGGTRISFKDEMQYGTIEATLKVAPGSNIVSSFILMAKNGDEIDFEFVGKDRDLVQTNFFYKGIPLYDNNALFFKVKEDLTSTFNKYTIEWTPEYYKWYYNGKLLRVLNKSQTAKFPDSPSLVQFGIWNAGKSKWAGPGVEWSNAPFVYSIRDIKISCIQQPTPPNPVPNVSETSPKSPTSGVVTGSNRNLPSTPATITQSKSPKNSTWYTNITNANNTTTRNTSVPEPTHTQNSGTVVSSDIDTIVLLLVALSAL